METNAPTSTTFNLVQDRGTQEPIDRRANTGKKPQMHADQFKLKSGRKLNKIVQGQNQKTPGIKESLSKNISDKDIITPDELRSRQDPTGKPFSI